MVKWLPTSLLGLMLIAPLCNSQVLVCDVKGSDDRFLLYPEQLILRSQQFEVYALMGGMTLATVSRLTLRFHRVTQLNLLPTPDRIQLFEGQCRRQHNTGSN